MVIALRSLEKRLEEVARNRLVACDNERLEEAREEDVRQRLGEVGREEVAA